MLVGTKAAPQQFQGTSVALAADDSTLAVGGLGDDGFTGATWVFTRAAGRWSQQGSKLVGVPSAPDQGQGTALAISADGSVLAVGADGDNDSTGAAWVFARSTTSDWAQQGDKLFGTGSTGTQLLGRAVALSAYGSVLALGGWDTSTSARGSGSISGESRETSAGAWVFTRSVSGAWTQQGHVLVGRLESGAFQEAVQHSVALSGDGAVLAVGFVETATFEGQGGAWMFASSGMHAA